MKNRDLVRGQAVKVIGRGGRLLEGAFVCLAKDKSPVVFIDECNAERNIRTNQLVV